MVPRFKQQAMQIPPFTLRVPEKHGDGLDLVCKVMGYTRPQAVNMCIASILEMIDAEEPMVPNLVQVVRLLRDAKVGMDSTPIPTLTPTISPLIRGINRRGVSIDEPVRAVIPGRIRPNNLQPLRQGA
jgi:hypothetical protein